MILIDANLLFYARVKEYPFNQEARHWLEDQLNSGHQVGLPWPTLLAFLRIGTNLNAFNRPLSVTRLIGPAPSRAE